MKKFLLWLLAFIITVVAAIYQRQTGPTYPKSLDININGKPYKLKLVRSLSLDERPEVRLEISDTSLKAKLYYKRFRTNEEYQTADFTYKIYPVHSFVMNKIFKMTKEEGFYAEVPKQPEAGKIQYYFEITDASGSQTYLKNEPVVIRFKGGVPVSVLLPHVLLMFTAMLFSTLAGLMAAVKHPLYKKYAFWTLILFLIGGFILGPLVQNYAFGEFWTGIPFGWDLTDNKTLIAAVFWILAVIMNRKHEKPVFTILAALILLLVFSIPHSMFGSEFNYASGEVTQGMMNFFWFF